MSVSVLNPDGTPLGVVEIGAQDTATELTEKLAPNLPPGQQIYRYLYNGKALVSCQALAPGSTLVALQRKVDPSNKVKKREVSQDAYVLIGPDACDVIELDRRIHRQMLNTSSSSGAEGISAGDVTEDQGFLPGEAIAFLSALAKDKGAGLLDAMAAVAEDLKAAEAAAEAGDGANDASDEPSEEEISAQVLSLVPEEAVAMLMEMGFPLLQTQRALLENRCDHEMAANALLTGCVGMDEFTSEEWRRYGMIYLDIGSSPGRGNSTSGPSGGGSGRSDRNANLVKLMDMGFPEADARGALRGAAGNFDEACAALLGDEGALQRIKHRQQGRAWMDHIEQFARDKLVDPEAVNAIVKDVMEDPQALLKVWQDESRQETLKVLISPFAEMSRSTTSAVYAED